MKIQFKWYDEETKKTYYTGAHKDYYAEVLIGSESRIVVYELVDNKLTHKILDYFNPILELRVALD